MKPLCSIIVPAHGRSGLTRQCVDTLLGQSHDSTWEIVVVDDGSPEVLSSELWGEDSRVRALRHEKNEGFANACNDGAGIARGDYLVFLNNDTIPRDGWLDALVRYGSEHPRAAILGSRLLYPDGTVQHAGVVICQDRYPRHLYAGLPGDHPAVTRPRRLQAVTAASMLVRREVFDALSGFDVAYRNGLEDADLCLRAAEMGHEIHYVPGSVVVHLESVSPGRFEHDRENARLWIGRWGQRIRPDDVDLYLEDGLLRFAHEGRYPVRAWVSPLLAVLEEEDRRLEGIELLVERLSWQVSDLLREVVRLTARVAEHEGITNGDVVPEKRAGGPKSGGPDGIDLQAARIEREILDLQESMAATTPEFGASPSLGYRAFIDRVRETTRASIPPGSTALVISRGDERLLEMDGIRCWHFPRSGNGGYVGYHPGSGEEAVAHLEEMRSMGARFLVIPRPAFWWLDHYTDLREHLEGRYAPAKTANETCLVYSLEERCRS